MKISDILTEDLVVAGLKGSSKNDIIDAMVELVALSPKVVDKEKVRSAILERERIMSTGVGNGFAIPHGKTDAVSEIVAAFAVTEEEIDYDSLDEKPVRLVFLLVGKDAQYEPMGSVTLGSCTFGTATTGSIVASGTGWCLCQSDAAGDFACTITDTVDETLYFVAQTAEGMDNTGHRCVVVASNSDSAAWSA